MINLEWKFRSKANRARTLIKGSTITLVTGASRNSENGLIYELESSVKGSSSQSRLILLENPFMLCVYCSKLKLEWARFRSPFILGLCRICDDLPSFGGKVFEELVTEALNYIYLKTRKRVKKKKWHF